MCAICGCGGEHAHDHDHAHAHLHGHAHGHGHSDARHPAGLVELEARILAKNDALAQKNRGWFAGREILALNLVGAPGAGKTALLERTIGDLGGEPPVFVIEGDQATANDAERIRAAGAPVVQLNTGTGCHLDAAMIARALGELRPPPGAAVLIENVGNLVCPALFDLGEHAKVVLFSVTEGEDKPVKYPHMFAAASLVLIAKIDLLPHVEFDLGRALASLRAVNPNAAALPLSARTGEGMTEWYGWLRRQAEAAREAGLI
jgi:hydrogenase nickel incorporation protein HypB